MSRRKVGPMKRDKDTGSFRHIATEQELKVAEKSREHSVEIEEEIEVDKQKAAESKGRSDRETTEGTANSYRSMKKPGRLQRRKPKNEKT